MSVSFRLNENITYEQMKFYSNNCVNDKMNEISKILDHLYADKCYPNRDNC